MSLFRYARDYYGDAAVQLVPAGAWLFVALVGIFVAIHLLRRSAGHPTSTDPSAKIPADARVRRFEVGARVYHWGNLLFVLGLALSAVALFRPGSLGPGPWLLIHEISAVAFTAALLLHIVVAPRRGEGRSMWFEARDVRDLRLIATNFLGGTRDYPAFGKYDPLQKLHHAFLTVLATALIFTVTFLFVSAEAWATFSHDWMRDMRLLHDLAGFAFLAILVGHLYFGIIRVNWPLLVSMWTGRLRGSSFNLYHDAHRWQPRDAEANTHEQQRRTR
jgi:Ni/Fe-hydrogenase 1 B-type cytochrome subunit